MTELPDLTCLSHEEKDARIRALWAQVQSLSSQVRTLAARVAELEAKLGEPPKTPDNSSVPPSQGKKPNFTDKPKREGPRKGSLGRQGGGRALVAHPRDETVVARAACCAHCRGALRASDHRLAARYDKLDLPKVRPVVTRVEQYAGHCPACGGTTLAPTQRDGRRLRKRYGKVRAHLFTFLDHPEIGADNTSSERELRPTATYRKVTGGFRSDWGKDLFAAFRSIVGTAARRGIDAYQAVRMTLSGQSVLTPG